VTVRIAVLSDIHGFDLAFETVIDDLQATGPYDAVVVAGDLCEAGPAPDRVIELIQEMGYAAVQGNTDLDIVNGRNDNDPQIDYARDMIGVEGIDWLARLPFELRFTPPGGASPADDLLVVHANPHDQLRALDPEMSDRELLTILDPVEAKAIAFGHIHICYIRQIEGLLLVDVSAVGNPKDGDLRCKYGVLTWNESARTWEAELRKLPYPLEETGEEMELSAMPKPNKALKKLKRASYKPFD
jgi:predicted phosphodiesterase